LASAVVNGCGLVPCAKNPVPIESGRQEQDDRAIRQGVTVLNHVADADQAFRVLPGGTTRGMTAMFPPLPRADRGTGFEIVGSAGQRWIDANNNFTALIHGHGHKATLEALHVQLDRGISFGLPTHREVELAELLTDRVPWIEQVRFCNSGTEAIMAAVRAARALAGRDAVVVMRPAYHGSADHVLAALGERWTAGVPSRTLDDSIMIRTGSEDELLDVMQTRGENIAAVIIDPAPQRAGGEPLSSEFMQAVRAETHARGALLIADEVVNFRHHRSGMTTGYFGVVPDLLVVGKIIGGGLPVGAVLGTRDVMCIFDPRVQGSVFHGGTFSGNPMTMVAGLETMRDYTDERVNHLVSLGDRFRARALPSLEQLGWTAIGFGSLSRLIPLDGMADEATATRVWWAAERRGVLLGPQSLGVALSTPMDAAVVDELAGRVCAAVHEVVHN
jgi:glutamate-1-semialdehyde 2,1-aminomutase